MAAKVHMSFQVSSSQNPGSLTVQSRGRSCRIKWNLRAATPWSAAVGDGLAGIARIAWFGVCG
jgi:hypothetical protein